MKYKINEVSRLALGAENTCIGLFSEDSKWDGRGNFCGWYGVELYTNATLLAYYEIDLKGGLHRQKGYKHLNEVVLNKKFEEIIIGSCYWEHILEAENDEEAIKKFFAEDFL